MYASTDDELGALAGQVGEQVRGGGQTGQDHVGVLRVRQLMKTPSSMQTELSVGAGEEADQEMHTVLLPRGRTDSHARDRHVSLAREHHFQLLCCGEKSYFRLLILDEAELC